MVDPDTGLTENAADAVDATQLSFNPGRPKDGEEITDFKRPGGH